MSLYHVGPVQGRCFYVNQNIFGARDGVVDLYDLKDIWATWFSDYGCAHL